MGSCNASLHDMHLPGTSASRSGAEISPSNVLDALASHEKQVKSRGLGFQSSTRRLWLKPEQRHPVARMETSTIRTRRTFGGLTTC